MSYFIQRGTTVKGPFSQAKLKALAQDKKLKNSDCVSESAAGPWEPLGFAYKRIFGTAQSGTTPTVLTIEVWKVKRRLFGKYEVTFECPACQADLTSDESDVQQTEYCPKCGGSFVLGQRVADEIKSIRERSIAKKATRDLGNKPRKYELQRQWEEESKGALTPPPLPIAGSQSPTQPDIQQTIEVHVTTTRSKSHLAAFLLAFFFGPIGMLYSTVVGALVLMLVDLVFVFPTFGMIVLITWPVGCIWAVLACDRHE